jgi:hypothetical protein
MLVEAVSNPLLEACGKNPFSLSRESRGEEDQGRDANDRWPLLPTTKERDLFIAAEEAISPFARTNDHCRWGRYTRSSTSEDAMATGNVLVMLFATARHVLFRCFLEESSSAVPSESRRSDLVTFRQRILIGSVGADRLPTPCPSVLATEICSYQIVTLIA